jgi:aryl-alcohol dehydrogenase-like predicted oxidoreductase
MVGKIEQRSFNGGARVSVLGIGCGRVASVSNPVPMREIEATLESAIQAGVNLFDTADIYGQGDSERTLARLLRRHRDQMFVVTKVGGRHGRYAEVVRFAKPLLRVLSRSRPALRGTIVGTRTATVTHDFSVADLERAVDASRRRLTLDRLDGLLLHSPSAETLRRTEIHDFLEEVLQSGKAAAVGVSVDSLEALQAAVSIPALSILQAPIEIASLLPGTEVLGRIRARKIGLFVRGVLHGGARRKRTMREAVSAALAPDFVTAAIIGVSTRGHFDELLSALP